MHINSAELADAIHVHPSAISRWKNGYRFLKPESGHFANIISYVVERDSQTEYKNIEVFLSRSGIAACVTDRNEAANAVRSFLLIHGKRYGSHMSGGTAFMPDAGEFFIHGGGREKRDALLEFFDYAESAPPDSTISIMISDDISYHYLGDTQTYNKWTEKLHRLVASGRNIRYIYNYDYRDIIVDLENFLWLFSCKNVRGFLNPDAKRISGHGNLLLVEGSYAMVDFAVEPEGKTPIFAFSDPAVVGQLERLFSITADRCVPIVNNKMPLRPKDEITFLEKRMYADNALYIYSGFPFCFPVSRRLIGTICTDNGFSEAETARTVRVWQDTFLKPILSTHYKQPRRIILNFDKIFEMHQMGAWEFPSNLISEKPLIIHKRHFHTFIEKIIDYVSSPPPNAVIEIALIDDRFARDIPNCMFVMKENLFAFAHLYDTPVSTKESMLFSDIEIVNYIWKYFDKLWSQIPSECMSARVIASQLSTVANV
jgi:hypothetical protein